MRRKVAFYISALAAGILAATVVRAEGLFQALIWPFEALGDALRWLSLSSAIDNVLAIVLYIALALLPAGCFFRLRRRMKRKYDFLWLVLSGYCFFLIYWLINPQALFQLFSNAPVDPAALPTLKGTVILFGISLVLAGIMFRLADTNEAASLLRQLSTLLSLLLWLILFSIAAFGFSELINGWANAESGARLSLILKTAAGIAPQIAAIIMFEAGRALLDGMGAGWFRAENIALAERLAKAARFTLYTSLWCMLVINGLELAFTRVITDVNVSVNVPLSELASALAALILARYISASCAIKRENDLMI